MPPSIEQLTRATAEGAAEELESALKKIKHCVDQLTDEQVWWRPVPQMNSIANLILHMCGNVRQWIISGFGGAEDHRDRPREFSERGPIETARLLEQLAATVSEANSAIANGSPNDYVQSLRIQSFETSGIGAIFHSVAHFRGHVQEIVHMTRMQLGDRYQFEFVPRTPEQGAGNR